MLLAHWQTLHLARFHARVLLLNMTTIMHTTMLNSLQGGRELHHRNSSPCSELTVLFMLPCVLH